MNYKNIYLNGRPINSLYLNGRKIWGSIISEEGIVFRAINGDEIKYSASNPYIMYRMQYINSSEPHDVELPYSNNVILSDRSNLIAVFDDGQVTSIGDYSFLECNSLTAIDLSGVTKIGKYSFSECTSLNSLSLNNVSSIGQEAFFNCLSLSSIYIDNSTLHSTGNGYGIDNQIVVDNDEKNIIIGVGAITELNNDRVSSVCDEALRDCNNLKSLNLPNALEIGQHSFQNCSTLNSANIPNVNRINRGAFTNCYSLSTLILSSVTDVTRFENESTAPFDNWPAISVYVKNSEMFDKFSSSIHWWGFLWNENRKFVPVTKQLMMKSVDGTNCYFEYTNAISSNLTYQVKNARGRLVVQAPFNTRTEINQAQKLAAVVDNGVCVQKVNQMSFSGCSALTSVNLPAANTVLDLAFNGCCSLLSVNLPSLTSTYSIFSGCTKLSSIFVNNSVLHSIGNGYDDGNWLVVSDNESQIYHCAQAITHVSNDNLDFVNVDVFFGCYNLSSVYLPNVTTIENAAFGYCSSISSVFIPKIAYLGSGAFFGCEQLKEVVISAVTVPPTLYDIYVFAECPHLSVYVKNAEVKSLFEADAIWKQVDAEYIAVE